MLAAWLIATVVAAAPVAVKPGAEPGKSAQDERICRTQRVTGSRLVKRVCTTAAERQKQELEARNALRRGSNTQIPEAFKQPGGN